MDPRLGEVEPRRCGGRGRGPEHRLPARPGGLQHPAGDGGGQRVLRGVYVLGKAATLNADVGDVMLSTPCTTSTGLDLLARQRVQRGRHRAGPALRQRARQPARGDREEHLPPEPLLPGLLLPRGVHGGGDGGGAVLNAIYEISDADRHPVGEAVNFSKLPVDFGIIHYASDTPYTQARTLGARGLSSTGWTRRTRPRWRSCDGSCGSRACSTSPRGRAGITVVSRPGHRRRRASR